MSPLPSILRHVLLASVVICGVYASCCGSPHAWRKLNGQNVQCFQAANGGHVEFDNQYSMNIYKLKYVRRSGYHECEYGHGGYFGCEAYPYHSSKMDHHPVLHHTRAAYGRFASYDAPQQDETAKNDETKQNDDDSAERQAYAPGVSDTVQGPGPHYMQQISVYLTDDKDNVLMPQHPFTTPYFTEPSINRPAWDNSITLQVNDGPLEILATEKLRLYFGEDLYDVNSEDNSGELCMDVYAYGELIAP